MKKIKVLYVHHESNRLGGSSYSLLNLIKATATSVEPIVLVRGQGVCDFFQSQGIKCFNYKFSLNLTHPNEIIGITSYIPRAIRDSLMDIICIERTVKLLKKENIDIVHSNSSVIRIGPSLAKKLHAKHVWHIREFIDLDLNRKPFGAGGILN